MVCIGTITFTRACVEVSGQCSNVVDPDVIRASDTSKVSKTSAGAVLEDSGSNRSLR